MFKPPTTALQTWLRFRPPDGAWACLEGDAPFAGTPYVSGLARPRSQTESSASKNETVNACLKSRPRKARRPSPQQIVTTDAPPRECSSLS